MSLILIFHNDRTGDDDHANYNVRVLVGNGSALGSEEIATGRVEGHRRGDGWEPLVLHYVYQRVLAGVAQSAEQQIFNLRDAGSTPRRLHHFTKVAKDCWHLIRALGSTDVGAPMKLKREEDLDSAAVTLIEMACDACAESFAADVKVELLQSGSFSEQLAAPDRALQRWREPQVIGESKLNNVIKDAVRSGEWAKDDTALFTAAPDDKCAVCQHPAKNHVTGRCRKRRCGCGRFVVSVPSDAT